MGENDEGSCCLKRAEALILKVAQVPGLTSYPEVMAMLMNDDQTLSFLL